MKLAPVEPQLRELQAHNRLVGNDSLVAIFRTAKSQLDTRPIFHQCDDTIRGHVFCSFLALLLRVELEERLARRGWKLEWADIVQDLDRLQQIDLTD